MSSFRTLLTAGLPARLRPRAEAAGEVTMGLAAAVGATGAGLVASGAGWTTMMVAAGIVGAFSVAGVIRQPSAQGDGLVTHHPGPTSDPSPADPGLGARI